jgi:dephospho-CoA kinase
LAIIARQMPDAQKRRRADLVVRTGLSRNTALRPLRRLIHALRRSEPAANIKRSAPDQPPRR